MAHVPTTLEQRQHAHPGSSSPLKVHGRSTPSGPRNAGVRYRPGSMRVPQEEDLRQHLVHRCQCQGHPPPSRHLRRQDRRDDSFLSVARFSMSWGGWLPHSELRRLRKAMGYQDLRRRVLGKPLNEVPQRYSTIYLRDDVGMLHGAVQRAARQPVRCCPGQAWW